MPSLPAPYITLRSPKLIPLHHIRQRRPSASKGFTLLELLVTVAIIAVMASIAYPSYSKFIRQWRGDSATKALLSDLQLARSLAIKTSRTVKMCTVATGGATCGTATDWQSGWLVIDGKDTIVANRSALQGVKTMSSGVKEFKFLPNGLMQSGTGTVTVTPSGTQTGDKFNQVTISSVGRAEIAIKTAP